MQSSRTNRPARLSSVAGLALAASLAVLPLAGCGSEEVAQGSSSAGSAVEVSATSASAEADASAVGDGEVGGSSASSGADGSASSDAASYSFSDGLTDEGLWEGVTALDYVTLPEDYASVSVPADEVAVTDDEVQEQIDTLASSFATTEQVTDRAVEDGDSVNIDYVGSIDGVEFDGGSTEGAGTTVTAGSTAYIDDFLTQIIGHMPGETFDVDVTFPDDYGNEELNGKDATFVVTINYITETTTPTIDDEWVSEYLASSYGWTTVDEMKASILSGLESNKLLSYLQSYVIDGSEVSEVPASMVEAQWHEELTYYQKYADMYGMDLASMLAMVAGVEDADALYEANLDSYEESAKAYLIYQAIAESQGVEVTDEDLADYFETNFGSSDYSSYEENYGLPYLKLVVLCDKVDELLVDGSSVA